MFGDSRRNPQALPAAAAARRRAAQTWTKRLGTCTCTCTWHMHMRMCMCVRARRYAAYSPSQTAFAAHACLARGQAPLSLSMATEELYDVDDGPLLRKRRMVMTMCTVQIVVSLALLANARRNLVLLVLNPFFVAAGALGYVGAKRCQPLLVMAHFLGSAGLSLLFGLFVLAEVRARSLIPLTTHRPPTTYCFFTRPSSSAPARTCSTSPLTCRWTCCSSAPRASPSRSGSRSTPTRRRALAQALTLALRPTPYALRPKP